MATKELLEEEEIQLKYVFLEASSKETQDIFPGLTDDSILLGAVTEDNNIVGMSIFSASGLGGDALKLDYIYVDEGARDAGVATSMLQFAEECFKEVGITSIFARVSDAEDEMEPVLELLEGNGYISTGYAGAVINYDLAQIKESDFANAIKNIDSTADAAGLTMEMVGDDLNVLDMPISDSEDKSLETKLLAVAYDKATELGVKRIRFSVQESQIVEILGEYGVYPISTQNSYELVKLL